MQYIIFVGMFFLTSTYLSAQDTLPFITIKNPSFEDKAKRWSDCGEVSETPYDVHESGKGNYGVTEKAKDGRFFVGFVARDNGTTEGMGQRLSQSLIHDKNYSFSAYLRRTKWLRSVSRKTGQIVNYNKPVVLAIYGGNEPCKREELLAKTGLVDWVNWKKYEFVFSPSKDYKYLIFKILYGSTDAAPYNGALLLDKVSNIKMISNSNIVEEMQVAEESNNEYLTQEDSTGYYISDKSFEYQNWANCDKDNILVDKWSSWKEPFGRKYAEMPTRPYDGKFFLGLIVKWNRKTASVTQIMQRTLKKGKTYRFSAFLQRPKVYIHDGSNYIRKVKLGIFGGTSCDSMDLLALSPIVSNKDWQEYTFYITPKKDCYFIRLKAMHVKGKRYNGGLLIDHLSDFVEVKPNQ